MRTKASELIGIDVPIFGFSHCRDVVAAVTNAGGCGVLGAVSHSPEQLDIDLNWIEQEVKGKPYGVDLLWYRGTSPALRPVGSILAPCGT